MDPLVRFDLLPQGRDTSICEESGVQGIFSFPRGRPSMRARSESQKYSDGEVENTARVSQVLDGEILFG